MKFNRTIATALCSLMLLISTVIYGSETLIDFRDSRRASLQSVLTKLRIRPGCTERVQHFLKELHKDPTSLLDLLEEAGIVAESDFIERTQSGDYLYVFKRLKSIDHLKERIANSTLPLSQRIRETLVPCVSNRIDIEATSTFLRDE